MNTDGYIRVIHGANDGFFALAGRRVSTARASLIDAFNIPPEAISFINGQQVDANFILKGGYTVEFIKKIGKKGRYPGGKAKLSTHIIPPLTKHISVGTQYREPFFGWGAIGLELVKSRQVNSIWINDKHPGVAAFWTSVIRYPEQLKELVMNFQPSRETFFLQKEKMLSQLFRTFPKARSNIVMLGFEKLVLHRLSYSGLGEMAGGPLSAICSRWNPKILCKKIDADHLAFANVNIHNDCCTCLDFDEMIGGEDNLLYLDPPYYHQGPKCYPISFSHKQHERLAGLLQKQTNPWLLSYDDCSEVRSLYEWALVEDVEIKYSIARSNQRTELLIRSK